MPDRDYYLADDAKLKDARAQVSGAHREDAGHGGRFAGGCESAAAILKLETSLARVQWTRVDNRDPVKTYNKTRIGDLPALMPGYDWQRYVRSAASREKWSR